MCEAVNQISLLIAQFHISLTTVSHFCDRQLHILFIVLTAVVSSVRTQICAWYICPHSAWKPNRTAFNSSTFICNCASLASNKPPADNLPNTAPQPVLQASVVRVISGLFL